MFRVSLLSVSDDSLECASQNRNIFSLDFRVEAEEEPTHPDILETWKSTRKSLVKIFSYDVLRTF